MKNRKILLIILIVLIIVVGGGTVLLVKTTSKTPTKMTDNYLKRYTKLDRSIVNEIEYEFDEELSSSQKNKYIEIMKKQYEKMTYSIKDEVINENEAVIKVNVKVCDLASTIDKANSYINSHSNEFNESSIVDYKLDELNECSEQVNYSIEFSYYRSNGQWIMNDISENDLKKINGTY